MSDEERRARQSINEILPNLNDPFTWMFTIPKYFQFESKTSIHLIPDPGVRSEVIGLLGQRMFHIKPKLFRSRNQLQSYIEQQIKIYNSWRTKNSRKLEDNCRRQLAHHYHKVGFKRNIAFKMADEVIHLVRINNINIPAETNLTAPVTKIFAERLSTRIEHGIHCHGFVPFC